MSIIYVSNKLPDIYNVTENDPKNFSLNLFSVTTKKSNKKNGNAPTAMAGLNGRYNSAVKFLNIVPIKSAVINTVKPYTVVPCGTPFGVKLFTGGALVIGVSQVKCDPGISEPGKTGGIQKGDIITAVNNTKISSNQDLENIIQNSKGEEMHFSAIRNEKEFNFTVKPEKSAEDGKYRIGIWVRDSCAGIGTLTFFQNTTGAFAGLGHGICDCETEKILPISHGEMVDAVIIDTIKGYGGTPGELKGCFTTGESMGKIYSNTSTGIYGVLNKTSEQETSLPVAMRQNVKTGPAQILTTIEGGTPQFYSVNIESVNYDITSPTKNIKLKVTDSELLERTGGIVQGMSGSPIIQNGGIIGAVTHVLVSDPSKGYAIFAETMMTNSNSLFELEYKKAS